MSNKPHITGVVLRCRNKDVTADFYSKLGLVTRGHQHGGPLHYEMKEVSKDFVVELYQLSENFSRDALMLEVVSINKALLIASNFGISTRTGMKQTSTMKFVYIRDPDNRDVMLIEKLIK